MRATDEQRAAMFRRTDGQQVSATLHAATPTAAPGAGEPGGRKRIAVIGGGIAGLGAAWLLRHRHDVTLYEKEHRLGGHSHTVDAAFPGGQTIPVDTGFIVYNRRNYPELSALFDHLGVPTRPSDMSFSVSVDAGRLEWAGDSPLKLFGQPRNLLRPSFHRMIADILRFNRDARTALHHGNLANLTLGRFLAAQGYGAELSRDYLLPMGAAIWSAPTAAMADFPAESFLRFFENHGLLDLRDRPSWRTVEGGSRSYVQRLADALGPAVRTGRAARRISRTADGATVTDNRGERDRYDGVVLACHADQALALLADPDPDEAACLRAIRFQANEAVLHSDPSLMPRRRRLWSSWNYLSDGGRDDGQVSVSYWMNRLQGIDRSFPLFVTLNPSRPPAADKIIGRFAYDHPVFDMQARDAQHRLGRLQGRRGTWYCGAWTGYGFHEDGLRSAIAVALALGSAPPWATTVRPAAGPAPADSIAAARPAPGQRAAAM